MSTKFLSCILTVFLCSDFLFGSNEKPATNSDVVYDELFSLSQKTAYFSSINALLSWDQETYMPKGGISLKSNQMALMSQIVHREKTCDTYKNLLGHLISLDSGQFLQDGLSPQQKANIREWRKDFLQESKLPSDFVENFSKTVCISTEAWKKAKSENSFTIFKPHLEKLVALSREKANYLGYEKHPYDALLNLYEPNMTCEKLDILFSHLKPILIDLLQKIKEKKPINDSFLYQHYPREQQLHLAAQIMQLMTLDTTFSRMDESTHPFTEGFHSKDVRITTHIDEKNLSYSLFAVLHEGGHALYELGLPEKYFGTPLGQAASMAIHESQSRLWETILGQSVSFWSYFYPTLQKKFPQQLEKISLDAFYKGINKVEPSFIRIHADEVSYCLHIIIRYEIEKALIENTLKVADIPRVWNEKMAAYLGITPPSDTLGALQDVHWSLGYFGYFPTYALGNLYAAQFFEQWKKENPHWQEKIKSGDLKSIRNWLLEKIHQQGRFYTPEELVIAVTGKKLSEEAYIHHLKEKFSAIYLDSNQK
jgi:carboxypeptidase Taq